MKTPDKGTIIPKTISRALKIAWLPVAVFVAFELTVPDNVSLFRSASQEHDQPKLLSGGENEIAPVAPKVGAATAPESLHSYYSLDDAGAEGANTELGVGADETSLTALGEWSGRFAGIIAGDEETDCWSAYDFSLVLNESESGVSGSGSYWVNPATCSSHSDRYVSFVDAAGMRAGSRVTVDLSASGDGQRVLKFDGLIMQGRLSGWFYSPSGKPVSGPVILARAGR